MKKKFKNVNIYAHKTNLQKHKKTNRKLDCIEFYFNIIKLVKIN